MREIINLKDWPIERVLEILLQNKTTKNTIPVRQRIGLLDRKLRIVNENTYSKDEWLKWTKNRGGWTCSVNR